MDFAPGSEEERANQVKLQKQEKLIEEKLLDTPIAPAQMQGRGAVAKDIKRAMRHPSISTAELKRVESASESAEENGAQNGESQQQQSEQQQAQTSRQFLNFD